MILQIIIIFGFSHQSGIAKVLGISGSETGQGSRAELIYFFSKMTYHFTTSGPISAHRRKLAPLKRQIRNVTSFQKSMLLVFSSTFLEIPFFGKIAHSLFVFLTTKNAS